MCKVDPEFWKHPLYKEMNLKASEFILLAATPTDEQDSMQLKQWQMWLDTFLAINQNHEFIDSMVVCGDLFTFELFEKSKRKNAGELPNVFKAQQYNIGLLHLGSTRGRAREEEKKIERKIDPSTTFLLLQISLP